MDLEAYAARIAAKWKPLTDRQRQTLTLAFTRPERGDAA